MATRPEIDIGAPASDEEVQAYRALATRSLLFEADQTWPGSEGIENLLVARAGGEGREVTGGLIAQPLGQYFGGRRVGMAGLRAVATAAEHRGHGIASALVRASLERAHDAGQPIAALFPATNAVYRRAGFELAGSFVVWSVPLDAFTREGSPGRVRPGGSNDLPLVRALYDAHAIETPGHLDRSDWLWDRLLVRLDGGGLSLYVVEVDGRAEGYVALAQSRTAGLGRGQLRIVDRVTRTPAAASTLRAFLAGYRSRIDAVELRGAPSDALLMPLWDQRQRVVERVDWMVRLVDVAAALRARGYPHGLTAELHLEVTDDVLGWNEGRFVLALDGRGAGEVNEGGRGELRADVRQLAPLFTGAQGARALASVGGITGSPEVLDLATGIFAGPAPWMPDIF